MLKNYIKVALRNILRHKGYSFINIVGLAVGMAFSLLLFLWVADELSFDRFHSQLDTLYRVAGESRSGDQLTQVAVTSGPVGPALKDNYAEIVRFSRFSGFGTCAVQYGDLKFTETTVMYADPDFLTMFDFSLIDGDPARALSDPGSIVLTETAAARYFGDADPIGKTLRIDGEHDFAVMAVAQDPPANSSLRFEFLVPFEFLGRTEDITFWGANRFSTFVQCSPHSVTQDTDAKIAGLMGENDPTLKDYRLYLQPFADIHLRSQLSYDFLGRSDIKYVWILVALGLLILVIACINFMNLATARAGKRAGEIGLRKVIGGDRFSLAAQFLGEAMTMVFIALFLALGLAEALLPVFNDLSGKALTLSYTGGLVAGLAALTVFTGVLAGSYPAVLLSSMQPAAVLKGAFRTTGRSRLFRKALVVTQFTMTAVVVVGTIAVSGQMDFLRNKELGFDKDLIVYMPMRGELLDSYQAVKSELLASPVIEGVTASFQLPNDIGSAPGEMEWEGKRADQHVRINAGLVDFDYFEVLGLEMAAGRVFSRDFATDTGSAYIVNETAVAAMEMTDPIGKRFSFWDADGQIVGVVKDFHSQPLTEKINPLVLRISDYWLNYIHCRVSPGNHEAAIEHMGAVWETHNPDQDFTHRFLDESVFNRYRSVQRMGEIFHYFAYLAILISCLGLFGLAAFVAEARTREIGIRKVLGASIPGIMAMLSREFALLVVLANLIAAPLGYVAVRRFLDQFAYHAELGATPFALTALLSLGIALLTVGVQAFRAARANPVESLKCE